MASDCVTLYDSHMKIKAHEEQVTQGGGQYLSTMHGLVWFNSPQTGSTLALPEMSLTIEKVRSRILSSDKTFTNAPLEK